MKSYLRSCDCTGSFIFWLLVDIRNVSIRVSHCNSSLETSLKFSTVPLAVVANCFSFVTIFQCGIHY